MVSLSQQDISLLTFQVGSFRFCVDALTVEAIIEKPRISSVPGAPPSVAGVFTHHGNVTVVISLRRKFGLQETVSKKAGQVIVTRINGEPKGFWVDKVLDLNHNSELQWQKLPSFNSDSIFDKVVLRDEAIFLHTEFEKLFYAEDATDLYSCSNAAVGDNSAPMGFSADLAPENHQKSEASKSVAAVDELKSTEGQDSADGCKSKILNMSEHRESVLAESVHSGFSNRKISKAKGREPVSELNKKIPPRRGTEYIGQIKPAIQLYSGAGSCQNPSRQKSAWVGSNTNDRQRRVSRSHAGIPGKKNYCWKMALAGLVSMIVLVLGAFTFLGWLDGLQSQHDPLIREVYVEEPKSKTTAPGKLTAANDETANFDGVSPGTNSKTFSQKTDRILVASQSESAGISIPEIGADDISKRSGVDDKSISQKQTTSMENSEAGPKLKAEIFKMPADRSFPINGPANAIYAKSGLMSPPSTPDLIDEGSSQPTASSQATLVEKTTDNVIEPKAAETSGEEIFRIETEDFMLTIRRPEVTQKNLSRIAASSQAAEDRFIHIVVKGDTLWDIADEYLDNPFRFPELAKLSHIKDPHWIYPGDVITMVRR